MTADEVRSRLHLIDHEVMRGCISEGIDLLTTLYGDWWIDQINTDQLNMNQCHQCIVGQVAETANYHEYKDHLEYMGIGPFGGSDYGFDCRTVYKDFGSEEIEEESFDYSMLGEGWRIVLCG